MAYWIGVDGGGSKTDFELVGEDGAVRAALKVRGVNPFLSTAAEVSKVFAEARAELCKIAGEPTSSSAQGTLICSAGGGPGNHFASWLREVCGLGEIVVLSDHFPILELCGGGKACSVVHVGTGSFVTAQQTDGTTHFWGGYGYLLGDPGSGADLGRRALRRLQDEVQGSEKATELGEQLKVHFDLLDLNCILQKIYLAKEPASAMAGCAPVVIRALDQGSSVAEEIVGASFAELSRLAGQVIAPFLVGEPQGVLGSSGRMLESVRAREILHRELERSGLPANFVWCDSPPIEGVRRLLKSWMVGKKLPVQN